MKNLQFGVVFRGRKGITPEPLPLIDTMMLAANKYYNRLVEIENARRLKCAETMRAMFPDYATAYSALQDANAAVDAAYQAIADAKRNSRTGKYPVELDDAVEASKAVRKDAADREQKLRKAHWKASESTAESRKSLKEAKARLPEVRKEGRAAIAKAKAQGKDAVKVAKQLAKENEQIAKEAIATAKAAIGTTLTPFQARAQEFDEAAYSQNKAARAEAKAVLGWGGYQQVDEACNAAKDDRPGGPLRFKSWNELAAISIHIQNKPLTWQTAMSGDDPRLTITRVGGKLYRAVLRIAEKPNRVTVTVPFVLHRPVHPAAKIKWAKLFRDKIGVLFQYSLMFTVNAPDEGEEKKIVDTGHTVAVNFGWRIKSDRSVRVAYWVGTDGRDGEIAITEKEYYRLFHARDIQAIRDLRFNAARKELVNFLATCPSELHRERFKTLPQWRSCEGLLAAYYWWLNNRLSGDDGIVATLKEYATKERHLHDYQDQELEGLLGWRKWKYRNETKELRKQYSKIILADVNFAQLSLNKGLPEDHAKKYKALASVSQLQEYLEERFDKVETVKCQFATQHCHQCGEVNEGLGKSIVNKCEGCGAEWDIDENNCRNLIGKGHLKVIERIEAARESEREVVA